MDPGKFLCYYPPPHRIWIPENFPLLPPPPTESIRAKLGLPPPPNGCWPVRLCVPASVKMGLEVAESLPAGSGEDWLCWRAINRLRTGVGRAKAVMMRWGYIDDAHAVGGL